MSYQRRASTEPEPPCAEILFILFFVVCAPLGWIALWNVLGDEMTRQLVHYFGSLKAR